MTIQKETNEFIDNCMKTASLNHEEIIGRLKDPEIVNLLHSAMGMSTEANEILDVLKKHIFYGKELDLVNIEEELGDSNWYQSLAIHSLRMKEYQTSWEQIWDKVIKKLSKRYGSEFNKEGAINRDLQAEREILEEK